MSDLDFLGALERESARFLAVLRDADPGAPVPSCPGWDAAELLWHLTGVQWFWATIVEERRQDPEGMAEPTRPGGYDELVEAFEEQSSRLLRVLHDADPAEPVYMWAEDRTAGYVRRRQAHEALVHRLDVRVTDTGLTVPVVLGRFTGTDPDTGTSYDEEDLSVRAADPGVPAATTVSGSADDLDAWLWHRRDAGGLSVEGDRTAYDRLAAALAQPLD